METLTDVILKVSSPAFEGGQELPSKYTCDGKNINPPINIDNLPENTISLALIIECPDVPKENSVHWIVWNIEPQHRYIEEDSIPGIQGKNSYGNFGYLGPCPPEGTTYHYTYNIYALDITLEISGVDTYKQDLINAINGHVLAKGQLMGQYTKLIPYY